MRKYVNSGKFNLLPVLLWTVIGMAAGAVLGIAYAFIAFFDPIIYLNLLVLAGLVYALAWVVGFIVRQSRSRNRGVNLIVTFLICLFAWHANWAGLMAYQFEMPFFYELLHPGALYGQAMTYANNIGWTLNGLTISPGVLKVFYVIEWLVFFIPMWMVAYAKLYYCEFCEDYMESKEHFITDVERVGQHLEEIKAGDLSCLNSPGSMSEKLDTEVDQQYKLDLHRCKSCGDRIFNLYHLTMKYKKGKSGAREVDKTVTLIEDTYALRPEGE